MPQYHSRKHPFLGQVTITPHPWWRNWFRFLPYFVGDRVHFRVQIETPQEQPCVYERFGGREIKQLGDLPDIMNNSGDKEIMGNPINSEGDVEYTLGFYGYPTSGETIITTRVVNKDRWSLGCVGLMVGMIVTIIAGVIINLINVDPAWHVWVPEWIMKWLR